MALHNHNYDPGHPSTPAPEKPTYDPSNMEGDDEFYTPPAKNKRNRRLLVGAVAAGAAAAFGVATLVGNNASAEKPEKKPAASAPETAGPTPQATSTAEFGTDEAKQDALDGKAPNPNTFPNPNWKKFPYQLDGEHYNSREEFIDAMSVSVEDYPEPLEALEQIVNVGFNNWLKSGSDLEELKKFTFYEEDQSSHYSLILNDNYYDPAFEKAIGPGIEGFSEMHNDYVGRMLQTMGDDVPYEGGYKFIKSRMHAEKGGQPDNKDYAYSSWMTLKFEDNGDQTTVGAKMERYTAHLANMTVEKRGGELYWKLDSMLPSEFAPQDEQGNDILPDNSLEESGY